MTKDEAKRLIQTTFESKFDKDKFKIFIRNIFRAKLDNRIKDSRPQVWKPFQSHITSWESIGKYEDSDGNLIDILTVKLKRFGSIEAARTAQRNFVKKYLITYEKTAALVAFYHEDSDDWRFSYVKTEFSLATKQDETTPAKRLSYPVGAFAKSHTAQKQLIQLLTNTAPPSLEELEQAFSIEIVTKEFFDRYLSLFKSLEIDLQNIINTDSVIKADFDKHSISTTAFAKKLLGQIVFLYFIQKKGWLGVPADKKWGDGDRGFIRHLFDKCSQRGENFYNDYLEFLFYEALAEQRNDSNIPSYYSKFDCRIPFLNGGLFEPINDYDWKATNITLDNSIFSNKIKTADGDTGTGILDVFDRYNFTVKEDEPLEKEVAVDPEMLGKVFENLLDTSERKSKGAFYTPREIVHYMCQESLVNFLETKLKDKYPNSEIPSQDDIRILIQKGNLFIELEQHISDLGEETKTYKSHLNAIKPFAKDMDEALAGIYVCDPAIGSGAFPVGMLTEIVNAREVLQSIGSAERKLSTYDIKRHTIQHCLYGVDIDATAVDIAKLRLWLSLVVDEEDFDSIKPLPNLDYKIACGNSLLGLPENYTSKRMNELENLKKKYFEETNHYKKEVLRNEINSYIKPTFDNSERLYGYKIDFDFRVNFSEVFSKNNGFDVVIGNPPYVRIYGDNIEESFVKYLKNNYISAFKKFDLYVVFIEKGIKILNSQGNISYIVPDKWLSQPYGLKIRDLILARTNLLYIMDLTSIKVFESATVDNVVFCIRNNQFSVNTIKIIKCDESFKNVNFHIKYMNQKELKFGEPFNLYIDVNEEKVLKKIKDKSIVLSKICYVNWGCRPTPQEEYIANHKVNDLYKPLIVGSNINRYYLTPNHRWVKYVKEMYNPMFKELFENETILFKDVIGKGNITAGLNRMNYYSDFTVINAIKWEKICFLKLRQLTIPEDFAKYSFYNNRFLLAIVNSKIVSFYFNKLMRNGLHTLPNGVKNLPIPTITNEYQEYFVRIMDRIFIKKDSKEDTTAEEREIDMMVYNLYELTEEEIAIVEGRK